MEIKLEPVHLFYVVIGVGCFAMILALGVAAYLSIRYFWRLLKRVDEEEANRADAKRGIGRKH